MNYCRHINDLRRWSLFLGCCFVNCTNSVVLHLKAREKRRLSSVALLLFAVALSLSAFAAGRGKAALDMQQGRGVLATSAVRPFVAPAEARADMAKYSLKAYENCDEPSQGDASHRRATNSQLPFSVSLFQRRVAKPQSLLWSRLASLALDSRQRGDWRRRVLTTCSVIRLQKVRIMRYYCKL